MYIFARTRTIASGKARAAMATSVEAATRSAAIVGFPVFTWAAVLGPQTGTVGWSARIEHLDDAMAADDALWADDEFGNWVEENDSLYAGPFADSIAEVVHGTPAGEPGAYVSTVSGVAANGAFGDALTVAVEIAETAGRLTGRTTLVTTPIVGPFASLMWITSYDDLAGLESDNQALAASDEWIKLVDRAGHAFAPGVTTNLLRRLN